jgi:uncharacterized protein YegP (UPF0339 family)
VKYVKYRCVDGWRWRFEGDDGRTVSVSSQVYPNEGDCDRAIEEIKRSAHAPVERA